MKEIISACTNNTSLAGYPLRGNHQCVWFVWNIGFTILIIIIISLGQILLSYISNTSRVRARTRARTHAHTHTHCSNHYTLQTHGLCNNSHAKFFRQWRYKLWMSPFWLVAFSPFSSICCHYDRSFHRSGCRCSTGPSGRRRPTVMQLAALLDGSLAINRGRSLVRSNKHSRGRHSFCKFLGVCFAYKKISRPNWDMNSWQEGLSVDTNSLRNLPRRSSKNCDLPFASSDRQIWDKLLCRYQNTINLSEK